MYVDVQCKGCGCKYRVPTKLSGRMAQCKECQAKFMVPYKNAAPLADDEQPVGFAEDDGPARKHRTQHLRPDEKPDDDGPARTSGHVADVLSDIAIERAEKERRKQKFGGVREPAFDVIPALVTDLWVPLFLTLIGYGLALYIAISHVAEMPGRVAGFILIGVVALLYIVMVVPLTLKMIESAANTLNFPLSNAAWLQTIALFSIPTLFMTIGFFTGGWGPMIMGLILSFAVMTPIAMVLYRVQVLTALQAVVLGALFFTPALAADLGAMFGIGLLIAPMWHLQLPWQDAPPVEVASTDATRSEDLASTPAPAAVTASAAIVSTAMEQKTPDVVAPQIPEGPVWEAINDAAAEPLHWPDSIHQLLYCAPPVTAVTASLNGSFVALFDKDSCDVYDLRKSTASSKQGGVKSQLRATGALLSSDGQFVATLRSMEAIDIWSVSLGKPIGNIAPNPGEMLPKPLAFVQKNQLLTSGTIGGKQGYQVWDTASGVPVHTIDVLPTSDFALSPGGRILYTLAPGKLTAIDLEDGKVVGESKIESVFFRVKGVDVSSDGRKLAAIVAESGPSHLVIFDLTNGTLLQDHTLSIDVAPAMRGVASVARNVMWTPDSAGVFVSNELFDADSGKSITKLSAAPVAGVEGQSIGCPSLFGALYAYQPASGGDRMVFKTTLAPRTETIASIKSIRGDAWEPPAESAPSGDAVALGDDPGDAAKQPAAPTFKVAELVRQGAWDVKIVSVAKTDPDAIAAQVKVESKKLPDLEETAREASEEVQRVSVMETYYDNLNNKRRRQKYSSSVISEARTAKVKADGALSKQKQMVKRLEREQSDAVNTRTVLAELANIAGSPRVLINVDSAELLPITDGLTAGAVCHVTGTARFADNTLTVDPRMILPQ